MYILLYRMIFVSVIVSTEISSRFDCFSFFNRIDYICYPRLSPETIFVFVEFSLETRIYYYKIRIKNTKPSKIAICMIGDDQV